MRSIIKDGQVVTDSWAVLRPDENGKLPEVAPERDVIVPFSAWKAEPSAWQNRAGQVAVWLAPDDEPGELAGHLTSFPLLAVDFPAFTDGRGYSIGRLLRERYHYRGELRALGDVWQDLVHYLWQVGFNSFEIKEGKALEDALKGFGTFSERYHSTWREPEPLFRRRNTNHKSVA
ncbi:DUF934 domain-containing protein [Pseudogulbenkiania ferrooxidans]|uniref:Oxidoreductase probably involved in sulfite reduction n=1 Tax=Pseudogulbenkiania ferrooxidans 2002 TaxID=279714 RepID=B9Z1K6_9NEIS|nr:DUF934 domain-containing protein [Pseudogulbenkiania ferrooxidans]EEG09301.1 conserved hypothetical protein [Pseudogulbenkiania ferrooxidans 2002]